MNKILVVGSSNIDRIAQVDHLPKPGETVGNAKYMQTYGGKGANQAVAAARLGGDVTFITSLGNDLYATFINQFSRDGIHTDHIILSKDKPTGTALILVADNAENCIAVSPGANEDLYVEHIAGIEKIIGKAQVVIMQAEIPYETITKVALMAHKQGVKVLLNPAPACVVSEELIKVVDYLVVNEIESEMISGLQFKNNSIDEISDRLLKLGAKCVIITLGKKGAYCKSSSGSFRVDGFKVDAIDTTAAGDTFCSALAIAANREEINPGNLKFACAAAALAVTKMGAQPSMPHLEDVMNFIKEHE